MEHRCVAVRSSVVLQFGFVVTLLKMMFMETMQQPLPSVFAQMVDRLKDKSEEELKLLYLKFFGNDLNDEWKEITKDADFKNATEEDIVKAIQKNRHSN